MKPRYKRAAIVLAVLSAVGVAVALVLNAFNSNLVFFYTPVQVAAKEAPQGRTFRVGGLVEAGSVVREGVTDLGGLVLLGYLATRGQIPGTWATIAMLILLVPQPVLLRLAKIAQARAGGGGVIFRSSCCKGW